MQVISQHQPGQILVRECTEEEGTNEIAEGVKVCGITKDFSFAMKLPASITVSTSDGCLILEGGSNHKFYSNLNPDDLCVTTRPARVGAPNSEQVTPEALAAIGMRMCEAGDLAHFVGKNLYVCGMSQLNHVLGTHVIGRYTFRLSTLCVNITGGFIWTDGKVPPCFSPRPPTE